VNCSDAWDRFYDQVTDRMYWRTINGAKDCANCHRTWSRDYLACQLSVCVCQFVGGCVGVGQMMPMGEGETWECVCLHERGTGDRVREGEGETEGEKAESVCEGVCDSGRVASLVH